MLGPMSDFHNRIMNLPCVPPRYGWDASKRAYAEGHRDARHEAARIAAEADALIEEQAARIARLERERAILIEWYKVEFADLRVGRLPPTDEQVEEWLAHEG